MDAHVTAYEDHLICLEAEAEAEIREGMIEAEDKWEDYGNQLTYDWDNYQYECDQVGGWDYH